MMHNHGDILIYNDFCQKHGFVCHPKEFYPVVNAIPKSIVLLLKETLSLYSVTLSLPSLRLDTLSIRDQKMYQHVYTKHFHSTLPKSTQTSPYF